MTQMKILSLGMSMLLAAILITKVSAQQNVWHNQTVYHLGDSQVAGFYGIAMGRFLNQRGAAYLRHGVVGKGVNYFWVRRQRIRREVQRIDADYIFVTMGGNDSSRAYRDDYPESVKRLDDFLSATAPTIWISPPVAVDRNAHMQTHRDRVTEIISENVRTFLDVRDVTNTIRGRTSDGIHFTRRGGERWAEETLQRITRLVNVR